MARSDLLLDIVRAGSRGDQPLFRKALEALVAEERAKQHHALADRLASHLHGNGGGAKDSEFQIPRREGMTPDFFFEIQPRRALHDLILPGPVLDVCKELIEEQTRADLLRSHNVEPRHRVLLAGPPGNGKTSLAEAIATELSVDLLVVRYESVITSFLGETAVRLSRLFDKIRLRRCVLFFDEFDVVGKERGDVHETGEIKRVVSSLLLQIDALPSYVVVVTATNHAELLDRAVWRRFEVRLELPPPTARQVQEWHSRFEQRSGLELGVTATSLAKRLRGVSFSELEQFGLDVQRRYILSLPKADLRRIVQERLDQWGHRVKPADADA